MPLPEPAIIRKKLKQREDGNAKRVLETPSPKFDNLSTNDYLGFSRSTAVGREIRKILWSYPGLPMGSTGSRLLSGNHALFTPTEDCIAGFHQSRSALLFNSGFDANVGLLSTLPQRNDLILYDELSHASIRQGLQLSRAKSIKFKHNDLNDLSQKITRFRDKAITVYIITESVFSMDGDSPDLKELVDFCEAEGCYLILDEAHALGVYGKQGRGLAEVFGLEHKIFARIVTFGKALGAHGAAILGSRDLRAFLINFSVNFIYTTALSPHSVAHILAAYRQLSKTKQVEKLRSLIETFLKMVNEKGLGGKFLSSRSAVQCCLVPGNAQVKNLANKLRSKGFFVKPVLSPTVPKGEERLRFCLHADLDRKTIERVLKVLIEYT